jgi:PAS domain S-box-containing protein
MNVEKISKVLVVDDNTFYLSLLKTILKDIEALVYMANSGSEALELIENNNFALAILDIQMPEMDGFELASYIRNQKDRDLLPIIFLTAYNSDDILIFKGYDNGAIDYLTKPVNKTIFLSKVRIFLELDKQKRSLVKSKELLQQSKNELEQRQKQLVIQNQALKKTKIDLLASEKLYHTLVKTSPDGIIINDLDGRVTEASDMARKLFAITEKRDIIGQHFINFVPRKSFKSVVQIINSVVDNGMVQNFEIELLNAEGIEFTGEISITQIKDNCGETNAFMSVLRDISDRKVFEKQLRHTERMTGIGEMATGMAHEINQPLNTISLSIDNILFSLENNTITEDYLKTKLNKVFDNITRIKKIIDHVRTFSRDQDDFVQTSFNVNECIRNSISMISEQFAHKEIELVSNLEKPLPDLHGNGYRFEQVILNLFVNAKDAIDEKKKKSCSKFEKKVTVQTSLRNSLILVEVKDNGAGIPPSLIDKVLLPFYTTKAPGQGTGLGLSVSYGIIKELGGEIEIKSEPNIGTDILIKIPIKENKNIKPKRSYVQ